MTTKPKRKRVSLSAVDFSVIVDGVIKVDSADEELAWKAFMMYNIGAVDMFRGEVRVAWKRFPGELQ